MSDATWGIKLNVAKKMRTSGKERERTRETLKGEREREKSEAK